MLLLCKSETGLSIVSFGHLFGPCWLKYELNMHPDVSKIILDTLRPASSKIRIIEISNLVLKKVKKHLFGHISASENILWVKICQNDHNAKAFEHTKFDSDLCRFKNARAANVPDLPIAVELSPLEQSG